MKESVKLLGPTQREYLNYLLTQVPYDPVHIVQISPYKKSKTHEQLGYLFGVVLPAIAEHVEATGNGTFSVDDIYSEMADKFAIREPRTRIDGTVVMEIKTASKMNVHEMSEFIDKILRYAAESLGCYIPDARYGQND